MLIAAICVVVVPFRASHGKLSVALVVLVPAVAAGFYGGLGTPDAATTDDAHQNRAPLQSAASSATATGKPIGSVASMLDGLKARLKKDPDDAGSWLLLAKSYRHLGQSREANDAYDKARALGKTDPAFEQTHVYSVPPEIIAPVDTGPALRGRISLSDAAAALVQPGDTVFIFAKESVEHRMPVVAVRKSASELPIDFVLTDRDAMMAGTLLAGYEQLVVTAKISRSGLATEVVEGLEIWSDPVSPLDKQLIELRFRTRSERAVSSNGEDNE